MHVSEHVKPVAVYKSPRVSIAPTWAQLRHLTPTVGYRRFGGEELRIGTWERLRNRVSVLGFGVLHQADKLYAR